MKKQLEASINDSHIQILDVDEFRRLYNLVIIYQNQILILDPEDTKDTENSLLQLSSGD